MASIGDSPQEPGKFHRFFLNYWSVVIVSLIVWKANSKTFNINAQHYSALYNYSTPLKFAVNVSCDLVINTPVSGREML